MGHVTIYTTPYCPFCMRAKGLLRERNIAYEEIDVASRPSLRDEISKKTGHMTVPMIFIGEEFIGGADELYALDAAGTLESKVNS